MEKIILSLLILKRMTIYEIRTYIQQKLSTICSDSPGSIQTALKKLLEKGYITVSEYTESNIEKKKYSITPRGVAFYKEWVGTPINISKMKAMEAGKLLSLGMAPREKRVAFLQQYIDDLRSEYQKLSEIKRFRDQNREAVIAKNIEIICGEKAVVKNLREVSGESYAEEVVSSLYQYQIYFLEHGLRSIKADIRFYEGILKKELEG